MTDAIEFARFCMNSAIEFIQDRAVEEQKTLLPLTDVIALAAPYAQIIEMRLWQLRQPMP